MSETRPVILAIDDTPANLLTLGSALAGEFDLRISTSGVHGLELAATIRPDLILLDVMMPEMDGFEVCRRLKADEQLKLTPVIFITALSDTESESRGLALGAADFLAKPLNVGIARQRIRNLIDRETLRQQVAMQRDQLASQLETLRNLSTAVEQSPASVVITDLEACIQYVNPRFTEVTGYSSAEAMGQNPRILQSGKTGKATYEKFWNTLSAGEPWKGELLNKRKNGEFYWEEAQIAPVKNPAGDITHYVAVKTDITQRKQLELAKDELLDRLRKIASRVPGVVYQYRLRPDGTSCFPFASEAIRQIYRVSPESVVDDASAIYAILHPDDSAGIVASIQHSAETLTPWRHEYRVRFEDGTVRWLFGDALPEREADGGTLWHGFITDVTGRKQIEAELAEHRAHLEAMVQARTLDLSIAKEAAEAASRAKTTFLATMSHELRTPLNGIIGLTGLAARRTTDERLKDMLGKVDRSSHQLLAIINDILDISKIEAERLTLKMVDFRLGEVLDNAQSLIAPKAAEKGLVFEVDRSMGITDLPVRGDPLRLGQVLLNLFGNAVKFTAEGHVTTSVELVEAFPDAVSIRFRVTDTGIGIAPEDQKRLFSAFEQADGSMTRRYGGTGLGLAITKRLVQLMGGEIGIASEVGRGSTFWFTVRLGKATDAIPPAPTFNGKTAAERLLGEYAGTRILVAEDEPINQEVSRVLLEDAGLLVDLAEDGQQAIELAKQNTYALILMDMQMPHLNGVESSLAIRALPAYAQTPILAMTANAFDENRQVCLDAGMNDHIAKPVDPDKLYETLLAWLEKRGN